MGLAVLGDNGMFRDFFNGREGDLTFFLVCQAFQVAIARGRALRRLTC